MVSKYTYMQSILTHAQLKSVYEDSIILLIPLQMDVSLEFMLFQSSQVIFKQPNLTSFHEIAIEMNLEDN